MKLKIIYCGYNFQQSNNVFIDYENIVDWSLPFLPLKGDNIDLEYILGDYLGDFAFGLSFSVAGVFFGEVEGELGVSMILNNEFEE